MEIKKTVSVDIEQKGAPFVLDAVQGEENTRVAELLLHLSGKKLDIDESDYVASIAYKKPDGTSGWYDTLSTGGDAYYWGESSITIKIDSQMLTVPGDVIASVRIESRSGGSISKTFPFIVNVSPDPANDAEKSENYYRVRNWDEVNAKIAELERLVGSGGGGSGEGSLLLDASLTQRGYAADAKAVGDALKEKQEKGNYVKTVNNIKPDGNGNVSIPVGGGETPGASFFNLAEMGLPVVEADGDTVYLHTDTSVIRSAMENGIVTFAFNFRCEDDEFLAEMTDISAYRADSNEHLTTKTGILFGNPMCAVIGVTEDFIYAKAVTLQPAGEPVKTPEKGVDYWTESDKAEIVAEVLAALPNAEGASF